MIMCAAHQPGDDCSATYLLYELWSNVTHVSLSDNKKENDTKHMTEAALKHSDRRQN